MLFYVSYDCNRAKVWYEGDLAVIKRKRKEILMKKTVARMICTQFSGHRVKIE